MINKNYFGNTPAGEEVYAYTLSNRSGTSVRILDLGGIIQSLWVKDAHGVPADVVCGYDRVEDYFTANDYQGALVGRCANRIAGGKFMLDGVEYALAKNDGNNHLHGGMIGFDKRIWNVTESGTERQPMLVLSLVSKDGEEGYPGTLSVKVTYTLTDEGWLSIRYEAMTDKPTVLNLTNHAYFNLHGYGCGDCTGHTLWIDALKINNVDSELIPDGTFLDVAGTPFDFSAPQRIADAINADHPMIRAANGVDHNFIFAPAPITPVLRATLCDPASGRCMDVYTDQPCMQVYTGNMIDECDPPFKGGVPRKKHCAICLETQAMPDSINHEGFTNVVLRPGEVYKRSTVFAFRNE